MTRDNWKPSLDRIKWYEKMVEAFKNLPEELKQELAEWERANKGKQDISEWPGWKQFIGKKPKKDL